MREDAPCAIRTRSGDDTEGVLKGQKYPAAGP
jgi:hypothetical protein